jgi:hypothetical protein
MSDKPENGSENSGTPSQEQQNQGKDQASKEIISTLRNENAVLRVKAKEIEKSKNDEIAQKDEFYTNQMNEKLSEAKSSYMKELTFAKLEAEAIREGIVDADIVKIIDISGIKLSEEGKIQGIKEAVEKFKKEKPSLFKKIESSTYSKEPPKPNAEASNIDVRSMSPEEYKKHKTRMLMIK